MRKNIKGIVEIEYNENERPEGWFDFDRDLTKFGLAKGSDICEYIGDKKKMNTFYFKSNDPMKQEQQFLQS